MIQTSAEVEALALKVEDNGGVYMVPAFTGLGAPYWNQHARGTIVGIVQWLRDGLRLIQTSAEVEALALKVEDNGGVYMVPAFTV